VADGAIGKAVKSLAAVAADCPPDVAPRVEPPASPAELADLEDACGAPLPDALVDLLRTTRAIVAMEIHNGCWIGGPAQLARSIRRRDFPAEIDAGGTRARALPFATDGGGNAFMLVTGGSVWRWDRETGAATRVADDLPAFLGRVADDWRRHLEGEAGSP
jgi:hypothetical protein